VPVETRFRSYWDSLAQSYSLAGPPLLPSQEDLLTVERAVAEWSITHPRRRLEALMLGVTPGVARLRWPEGASLIAVDHAEAMTHAVWPRDLARGRSAVCADWRALPCRNRSCDIVTGDGSVNCVRYPEGCFALLSSISDLLREDGLFILRTYIQPECKETPDEVFAAIDGEPGLTFPQFKFRLLMSVQHSAEEGAVLDRVYEAWAQRARNASRLAARTGWDEGAIRTIEFYRDSETVHTFPTLPELECAVRPWFEQVSISYPTYYLGERCPTLLLKPRR
jgi:hypothetical protein